MLAMEEDHGYEAIFVSDVPEYLKCVVCHMVLRDPIQIMMCGHRFCNPCFGRMKNYSQQLNAELNCPIDRKVIDLNKVFDDTGIARVVGDLQVKCTNNEQGCAWVGDLRDLQKHEDKCEHRVTKDIHDLSIQQGKEDHSNTLTIELLKRIQNCEDFMMEKEKDLAYLKFNLHEMKKHINDKEVEVNSLKAMNVELQNEMKLTKELSQELKDQFQKEMRLLRNEDTLMDIKVNSVGTQILEIKNIIRDTNKETLSLKSQLENLNTDVTEKLISCHKEIEIVKSQIKTPVTFFSDVKLKDQLNKTQTEIRSTRSHVDKSLNKQRDEITKITRRLEAAEKSIEDGIKELGDHNENVENILFCYQPHMNTDIKFKWVLQNYQYHFDIGENVCSPKFYTQINGYCFVLYVKWSGKKKENLGLFLKLCRGRNYHKVLQPFRMKYTFEILDKERRGITHTVHLSEIDEHRADCFTINPNENETRYSRGPSKLLTMPSIENYVINDMLLISCTFEHS